MPVFAGGFPGLRRLCSEEGGALSRDVPLFMALWNARGESARWPGQVSCTLKQTAARSCVAVDCAWQWIATDDGLLCGACQAIVGLYIDLDSDRLPVMT